MSFCSCCSLEFIYDPFFCKKCDLECCVECVDDYEVCKKCLEMLTKHFKADIMIEEPPPVIKKPICTNCQGTTDLLQSKPFPLCWECAKVCDCPLDVAHVKHKLFSNFRCNYGNCATLSCMMYWFGEDQSIRRCFNHISKCCVCGIIVEKDRERFCPECFDKLKIMTRVLKTNLQNIRDLVKYVLKWVIF
jgi:hypothetical protein